MKWIIIFLLLFLAIILETTITTLPLVFIVLLCAAVVFRQTGILIVAFVSGFILDILRLQTVGLTSLMLLILLTLAFLYERKFEIESIPFVAVFSFIGSLIYLVIFGASYPLLQAGAGSILAICLFSTLRFLFFSLKSEP